MDCSRCNAYQKMMRGCEKPAPVAWWTDVDGDARDRCPRRPILEDINWYNRLIGAFNAYKAGFLPHAGGMNNQAALFSDLMSVIDSTVAACDSAKQTQGNKPDGTMRLGMS